MALEVKLDRKGRIRALQGINGRIEYDDDGHVKSIGPVRIEYCGNGIVKSIGDRRINYYDDGSIRSVGLGRPRISIDFNGDHSGRIDFTELSAADFATKPFHSSQ